MVQLFLVRSNSKFISSTRDLTRIMLDSEGTQQLFTEGNRQKRKQKCSLRGYHTHHITQHSPSHILEPAAEANITFPGRGSSYN